MKKFLLLLVAATVLVVAMAMPSGAVGSSCWLKYRSWNTSYPGPESPVRMDWSISNPTSFVLLNARVGPSTPWSGYPPYTSPGPYFHYKLFRGSQHMASSGGFYQQWNFGSEPEPNSLWDFGNISVGKGTEVRLQLFRSVNGAWILISEWVCPTNQLPNQSI